MAGEGDRLEQSTRACVYENAMTKPITFYANIQKFRIWKTGGWEERKGGKGEFFF